MWQGFFGRMILKGGLVHGQIFNVEKAGLNSAFKALNCPPNYVKI